MSKPSSPGFRLSKHWLLAARVGQGQQDSGACAAPSMRSRDESPPSFDQQAEQFCSLVFLEIFGESVSMSGNS